MRPVVFGRNRCHAQEAHSSGGYAHNHAMTRIAARWRRAQTKRGNGLSLFPVLAVACGEAPSEVSRRGPTRGLLAPSLAHRDWPEYMGFPAISTIVETTYFHAENWRIVKNSRRVGPAFHSPVGRAAKSWQRPGRLSPPQ